ncbi:MAG TPA: hypothetical protein VIL20_05865 [Sandaracinaceae bacterium]
MSDEPIDDELRELGAPPRTPKKTLVAAILAGALAALALIAAAYYAAERDRAEQAPERALAR